MEKLNLLDCDKIQSNLNNSLNKDISLKISSTVDSTNDRAKEYVKKLKIETNKIDNNSLYVFAADFQKQGRGRRGHSWFSGGPEGLAVSFLFRAENEISKIPLVTAAAALAVNKTLAYFDLDTQIKWPNDILVSQKKIAGILSELVISNVEDAFVIIGCGINLNHSKFETELSNSATSYYLESTSKIDKNLFLAILIEEMDYYIANFFSEKRKEIIKSWKKALNLTGKTVEFTYEGKKHIGKILKILDNGDLSISFKNGQTKEINSLNTSLNYKSLDEYNG